MILRFMALLVMCVGLGGCTFFQGVLCVWDEGNCDPGGGPGNGTLVSTYGCNSAEAKSGPVAVKEMCVERRRLDRGTHWASLTSGNVLNEAAKAGGGPLYILAAEWTFNANKTKKPEPLNTCLKNFLKREMPDKYQKAVSEARFTYDSILWYELLEQIGFKLPTSIYAMAFGGSVYMNTAYSGSIKDVANHAHEIVHTQQAIDLGSLDAFGAVYFPAENNKTPCAISSSKATGTVIFSRHQAVQMPMMTVQIPTGTQVQTGDGKVFRTTAPGSILTSRTESSPVTVEAREPGAAGVVPAGSITRLVDGLAGVDAVRNEGQIKRSQRTVVLNSYECEAYQVGDEIRAKAYAQGLSCPNL